MNKQKYFIISLLVFSFGFVVFSYTNQLTALFAEGAAPNPGHSLSEMECTATTCITGEEIKSPKYCIGTSCITSWPVDSGFLSNAINTWITSADSQPRLHFTNNSHTYIRSPASMYFRTGGDNTRITIDSTGNVGIGTLSPAKKLDVIGDIIASGDICNGAGKCLNSIYQTNVATGSNPICPSGQDAIMKAYNGTWYTSDNPTITSWNKITCGKTLTSDGTPLLVYGNHTQKNCTDGGGTIQSDGTYNMCRFNGSSCPSGWTRYSGWRTPTAGSKYCTMPAGTSHCSMGGTASCTVYFPVATWGNHGVRVAGCITPTGPAPCYFSGYCSLGDEITWSSQVGCY